MVLPTTTASKNYNCNSSSSSSSSKSTAATTMMIRERTPLCADRQQVQQEDEDKLRQATNHMMTETLRILLAAHYSQHDFAVVIVTSYAQGIFGERWNTRGGLWSAAGDRRVVSELGTSNSVVCVQAVQGYRVPRIQDLGSSGGTLAIVGGTVYWRVSS
jgi:hypothetical protein